MLRSARQSSFDTEMYVPDNERFYRVKAFVHKRKTVAVIFEDITLMVKTRETLRESEERYRLLVEESHALLCELEPRVEIFIMSARNTAGTWGIRNPPC